MIKEIRKIKLDEFIKGKEQELKQLNLELEKLEEFKRTTNINEISKEMDKLLKERKRFFVKYFNKKKYDELWQTYKSKADLMFRMGNVDYDIHNKKMEIESINYKIENYRVSLEKQNLIDMGLDFNQALTLLNERDIDVTLTEEDKDIILKASERKLSNQALDDTDEVNMEAMKQYVLVHKTHYCPNNGRINTVKEVGVQEKVDLSLDKIGSLKYCNQRNTVHFAVNGEVGSHAYGNWDDCKYAVIIPFTEMPIDQLRCGAVMDTYIENGLNLPSSAVLLCPKEEIEKTRKDNPNVKVIGYSGQNVSGYADSMVGLLGYKVESVGMWSWVNQKDANDYYQRLEKSRLNVHTIAHTGSYERELEKAMNRTKTFESLIDKIVTEKITLTPDEVENLISTREISLSSYGNYSLKVQQQIFQEIVPFLQEKGIVIDENIIDEVMKIALINDKQTSDEQRKELSKSYCTSYSSEYQNDFTAYYNHLLMGNIFEQLNQKTNENLTGKSI